MNNRKNKKPLLSFYTQELASITGFIPVHIVQCFIKDAGYTALATKYNNNFTFWTLIVEDKYAYQLAKEGFEFQNILDAIVKQLPLKPHICDVLGEGV